MTESSRTPEGESSRCPLCSEAVVVEPSIFFGDTTCPHCGQPIWFLQLNAEDRTPYCSGDKELRSRILKKISEQFNVPTDRIPNHPSFLTDIDAESIDIVELIMALEAEFSIEGE